MSTKLNQSGEINVLLITLVLMVLLLVGAGGFGLWAYGERGEYKDNSDQKVAVAVDAARVQEGIAKDTAFAEAEKNPLMTYSGPGAFGSIQVMYPKTWSVYVNSGTSGTQPLSAFFNPKFVPSVTEESSVYALRVQVVKQPYASVVKSFETSIKNKSLTAVPYSLPKLPTVVGVRLDGLINPSRKNSASMVVFPLRDETIQIWTDNSQFTNDFNTIILPNLTFSP